jgi:peptide/nickel transport system permease protein
VTAPGRRPLLWGAAVAVGVAGACLLGGLLGRGSDRFDPVRTAFLPPGSRVTTVLLADGTFAAAPTVSVGADEVVVGAGPGALAVPRARVAAIGSHRYWLGSDRFGRDLLVMLVSGGRLSIAIAATSLLVAVVLGLGVGLAAASAGGWLDQVLMRLVDGLLAFPMLFLLILVAAVFDPGPTALVAVLGLTSWMSLARLVRGQVLALREEPFVLAAQVAGSQWYRIWWQHYLPHLVGPVAQDAALRLGDLIIAEATLSFLGLGVPSTIPTWGSLVADGQRVLAQAWWLATLPGLAIVALVVSLSLVGDGLQEMARDG